MNVTPSTHHVMSTSTNQSQKATPAQSKSAIAFREFMEKSPEEMQFEAFLKRNNLTQEQFDKLPQEEKEKLLKQFQEEMKQKVGII